MLNDDINPKTKNPSSPYQCLQVTCFTVVMLHICTIHTANTITYDTMRLKCRKEHTLYTQMVYYPSNSFIFVRVNLLQTVQ